MCCASATPQLKLVVITQTAVEFVPKGLSTKRAYFSLVVGGVRKNVSIIIFFFYYEIREIIGTPLVSYLSIAFKHE